MTDIEAPPEVRRVLATLAAAVTAAQAELEVLRHGLAPLDDDGEAPAWQEDVDELAVARLPELSGL